MQQFSRKAWIGLLGGFLLIVLTLIVVVGIRIQRFAVARHAVQAIGGELHSASYFWTDESISKSIMEPFQDDFILSLHGNQIDDEKIANLMKHLSRFESLLSIRLEDTSITDSSVSELITFTKLERLYLDGSKVSDEGLLMIAKSRSITHLDLGDTAISDSGIAHLSSMTQLKSLNLDYTNISNDGLRVISDLKQLTHLSLTNTSVDDEGVAELQAALPKLEISDD